MTAKQNGTVWNDTNGNELHAHGGYILQHEGYYYWYGEDRRGDHFVSVYRSTDLVNWEFRNVVLRTTSKAAHLPGGEDRDLALTTKDDEGTWKSNVERPKVLYNAKTKTFVMWAHYENGKNYSAARCCVATSDSPDGDFVYHGSFRPLGEHMSRDCTLFVDTDGTAYWIAAANENADLLVYALTEDWLHIASLEATLFEGEFREAPAVFLRDGTYYMLSSACTGWTPNQGKYSTAKRLLGPWEPLQDFGDDTTYHTQPAFVLPVQVEGRQEFLYWSDRWGIGAGKTYDDSAYVVLPLEFDAQGGVFIQNRADEVLPADLKQLFATQAVPD